MAIHVALSHKTDYRYDRLVSLGPHTIRQAGAALPDADSGYSVNLKPSKHFINWQQIHGKPSPARFPIRCGDVDRSRSCRRNGGA